MAPSRGLGFLLRARISIARPQIRRYSDFVRAATNPGNKSQVYISRSLDPYLNLSIEHYLLQKAPADSTILFLYTNRSSVIIGRNQNPWTEVNLGSLGENPETKCQLVRRRSGGGTVFHDEGNVNYSVICPSAVFNRDKHAEMVVKALKSLGVKEAKVNCRHDIVLDNAHAGEEAARPYKVSGSAYKLTRLRSLHHGTCLLNSGNLSWISRILKAPAKPFIKARGVESVSSAITNVKVPNESFEQAVVSEFSSLYGSAGSPMIVAEPEGEVPEIAKGLEELRSEEWIYEQTPQFTFSSKIPSESVKGSAALELLTFPEGFEASFTVRHGRITEIDIKYNGLLTPSEESAINTSLLGRPIHQITDWSQELHYLPPLLPASEISSRVLAIRQPGIGLNSLFGGKYSGLSNI